MDCPDICMDIIILFFLLNDNVDVNEDENKTFHSFWYQFNFLVKSITTILYGKLSHLILKENKLFDYTHQILFLQGLKCNAEKKKKIAAIQNDVNIRYCLFSCIRTLGGQNWIYFSDCWFPKICTLLIREQQKPDLPVMLGQAGRRPCRL